jgi:hypothetical protein
MAFLRRAVMVAVETAVICSVAILEPLAQQILVVGAVEVLLAVTPAAPASSFFATQSLFKL